MEPEEMLRQEVRRLLIEANLSARDRSDLYVLCGYMQDQDGGDSAHEEFLLMYLSGDRDWRDDFAAIFGARTDRRSESNTDGAETGYKG